MASIIPSFMEFILFYYNWSQSVVARVAREVGTLIDILENFRVLVQQITSQHHQTSNIYDRG